jgi:hypothetical protein
VSNGLIWFFGCQHTRSQYPPEIEETLRQAGRNRKELETVLTHYSRYPVDSLKLRAAEFLIVNMPGKYSISYDAPWENVATVRLRWTSSSNKKLVQDTYRLNIPAVKEDMRYITAKYLIENIELAFKVWRETPWGKHISFDIFCEEILPYRVDDEPLENWRKKVLTGFADLYHELLRDSTMTAITACSKVNLMLPWFRIDKDFSSMNYSMLMASSRSTCTGMATLAIFSMRAMGIPVTYDYTIQYPRSHTGHVWNSVRDSAGKYISFMGIQSAPGERHQGTNVINSKVYRKMFAIQNPVQTAKVHIPPKLRNHYIKDISYGYAGHTNIDVAVRFPPAINTGYAYLATLLFNTNGLQWNPVAWGQIENQYIHYDLIGKHTLYLPVYYTNGQQKPAGYPFFLDTAGVIQYFEPNITSCQEHVLYESGIPLDNGDKAKIIPKTTYELLYWNETKWQSLDKQIAKDTSISFRIPDNALLYLRTIGETNNNFPIFSIQNNKQHWLLRKVEIPE